MARTTINLVNDEYYHIYNRGVDKRNIVQDKEDSERFIKSLQTFNTLDPTGSIYQNSFRAKKQGQESELRGSTPKLVSIIAYCLNPNHYHLLLRQEADGGISEFMKRVGAGYTGYFNEKYERSGALFQGRFKRVHINTNEYLLHLGVYINLNNYSHDYTDKQRELTRSSWLEYTEPKDSADTAITTGTDIILEQFKSLASYEKFAQSTLRVIQAKKKVDQNYEKIFLE